MGCIIYFVLSHGRHPFARGEYPFDPMICQVKIKKKKDEKVTLSDLKGEDKFTAENLVRAMIKSNHESRYDSLIEIESAVSRQRENCNFLLISLNNMISHEVLYLMFV